MKSNLLFLGCLLVVLGLACKKDSGGSNQDFFPPTNVNTSVNLNFAQYSNLNNPLGYVYINEGYRGIIVYHTADDRFIAFDRTCPVNTTQPCAFVSMDSSNLAFRCGEYKPDWKPCCNSRFDANSGVAIQGEAKRPLKQYYTSRSGEVIYISSTPF